ncbi:MAG: hypothetical protein AB7R89_26275 [Dehalococcoidia bacterium]
MAASADRDPAERVGSAKPDVAEDPVFQRRSWVAERAGWVVMLGVLAAGLLGLFGSTGPLNRTTASDADGPLRVEYAPLVRHGAPTALQVAVMPPSAAEVRIVVSRDYLASVRLVDVLPEPERVDLAADAYVFVFSVAEGGAPLTITFEVESQQYWMLRGTIGLADGDPLSITQFVYP